MKQGYGVIGVYTNECYGVYASRAEAWRLGINGRFIKSVEPKRGSSWVLHTKIEMDEPVFVANLILPIEPQKPYMGPDTRVREIAARHKWEEANQVREVLG